jgi:hypothetical protein
VLLLEVLVLTLIVGTLMVLVLTLIVGPLMVLVVTIIAIPMLMVEVVDMNWNNLEGQMELDYKHILEQQVL